MSRSTILVMTIVYFFTVFGGTTPNTVKFIPSRAKSTDLKTADEVNVSERPLIKYDYGIIGNIYEALCDPLDVYSLLSNVDFPSFPKLLSIGEVCVSRNESYIHTMLSIHVLFYLNPSINITRFSYHFLDNFVENGNVLYFRQPEKYGKLRKWARGHLIPPNDFNVKPSRRITYSLLNTAPRFSLLHTGRWCQLEGFLRSAIAPNDTFLILSGTFGKELTTLRDPSVNFEIPVLQYIFKLVMSVGADKSQLLTVYIGINDPEFEKYSNCNGQLDVEPEYQNICENQCPDIFNGTANPETQCLVYCCGYLPASLPLPQKLLTKFHNLEYGNLYPTGDEGYDGLCDCDAENENNSQDDTEFIKQECYPTN